MRIDLHRGDCLEIMKQIPDGSVDMVLCDLTYDTTGAAALFCGRRYIGIEQDEYWAKVSEMRLNGNREYRALDKGLVLGCDAKPESEQTYVQKELF